MHHQILRHSKGEAGFWWQVECLCPSFLRRQWPCPFTLLSSWGPHSLSRRKPVRQLVEPVETWQAGQSAPQRPLPRSCVVVHSRWESASACRSVHDPLPCPHHWSSNSSQGVLSPLPTPVSCIYTRTSQTLSPKGDYWGYICMPRFSNSGVRIPLCS